MWRTGNNSGDVRNLKGATERDKAALALSLTLRLPIRKMEKESVTAGICETAGFKAPRVKVLAAAQIIHGDRRRAPFGFAESLKPAQTEKVEQQPRLP